MNSDQTEDTLTQLFEQGSVFDKLEKYVSLCLSPRSEESTSEQSDSCEASAAKAKKPRKATSKCLFPNLAGFCRYLRISTDEFERLSSQYPLQYGRILTVLEDEALNSELSPTLLSAYLKRRIGYDGKPVESSRDGSIQISFEHDIFEDGE